MRVEKFMIGMHLKKEKTGMQCVIDTMVYRRGKEFYLLPAEVLPEDYDFTGISRMNLDTYFDETKEPDSGDSLGYQINRSFDGREVTVLGSDALKSGSLLRVIEVEDELFLDGESFDDNIYYVRLATKLVVRNKKDDFRRHKEDDGVGFWDLEDEKAYVDVDVIYFRSLRELQNGDTGFTDVQRETFSAFAKELKENDGKQRNLKGFMSEVLTGLTAELEIANQ